jgi:hypothetical protein
MKMIDEFFKRIDTNFASSSSTIELSNLNTSPQELKQFKKPKHQRFCLKEINCFQIVVDLGFRPMIWKFHVNQRDEICRAYL